MQTLYTEKFLQYQLCLIQVDINFDVCFLMKLYESRRQGWQVLMDMVKFYALSWFTPSCQNRFLRPKGQKCQKPPRNFIKDWIIGPKLSFLNIFKY